LIKLNSNPMPGEVPTAVPSDPGAECLPPGNEASGLTSDPAQNAPSPFIEPEDGGKY